MKKGFDHLYLTFAYGIHKGECASLKNSATHLKIATNKSKWITGFATIIWKLLPRGLTRHFKLHIPIHLPGIEEENNHFSRKSARGYEATNLSLSHNCNYRLSL